MIFLRRARHIASIVTLLLLLPSCALAQSEPQEPRGAAGTQQPAATDPRGTYLSPLIIQAQPTPKTDEETAEEQRKKDHEAADRWWARFSIGATVVLGLLQLGAIGFQAYITNKQTNIINRQSDIMTAQRDAANAQSTYMRDGLIETRKAADAARDTAKTAHQSFVASSRVVMSIGDLQVIALLSRKGSDDQFVRVQYRIHNASNNPALVVEWGGTVTAPSNRFKGEEFTHTVNETFAPGKGLHFPLDAGPLTADDLELWDRNKLVLDVTMWVSVVDPQGAVKTPTFKRLVICGATAKPQSMLWSMGQELT